MTIDSGLVSHTSRDLPGREGPAAHHWACLQSGEHRSHCGAHTPHTHTHTHTHTRAQAHTVCGCARACVRARARVWCGVWLLSGEHRGARLRALWRTGSRGGLALGRRRSVGELLLNEGARASDCRTAPPMQYITTRLTQTNSSSRRIERIVRPYRSAPHRPFAKRCRLPQPSFPRAQSGLY